MSTSLSHILAGAWRAFRLSWKQLVVTDLAYKAVAFALLFPLTGLALRGFLALSGNQAVADFDILFFALSPLGLATIVVVGAVLLAVVALEVASLMSIGLAAERGTRIVALDALRFVAGRAGAVVRLGAQVVGRTLLTTLPFLAAGGAVYLWLLTDYDINFYLSEKPPVFWQAAVLIGLILMAMLAVLLPRLIGWTLAMPLVVFEDLPPARALRDSSARMEGRRARVTGVMIAWAVVSAAAGAIGFAAVRLLAAGLVPPLVGRPRAMLFAAGVVLVVWGTVSLLVSVGGMVAFALLGVAVYDAGGAADATRSAWLAEVSGAPVAWSARRVVTLLLIACLVAIGVGGAIIAGVPTATEVTIIAHRGAAGSAPENTMASFERAIADGTDWVELDVQETADGRVVVIHDADLMKVAGVPLNVWDATYEQLRDIDIGSWFAPEFADQRVPLLSDVLALCKGKAGVFIELKYYGHDQRLEQRVVDIVEAAGMASDVVVMSLKYNGIQKIRALRPDWRIGLLTAKAVGDLTRLDADFLAVNAGLATPIFVSTAHRRGKDAYVWTTNERIEMARFISRGIDGLITDEPAAARDVRDAMVALDPPERMVFELALRLRLVPEGEAEEGDDLEGESELGPAGATNTGPADG
ncbi:MAG: glycerophosphodiester phosphodiesterase [Acidobacteriota bacterium]|jgi:glycerophosphoryl diester phosphodiesterase